MILHKARSECLDGQSTSPFEDKDKEPSHWSHVPPDRFRFGHQDGGSHTFLARVLCFVALSTIFSSTIIPCPANRGSTGPSKAQWKQRERDNRQPPPIAAAERQAQLLHETESFVRLGRRLLFPDFGDRGA